MVKERKVNGVPVKSGEMTMWLIVITAVSTIVICSAISWVLISAMAPAKSVYATDITKINNTIGHIQDAATGLDRLAGYQGTTTQTQLDDIDGEIMGIYDELDTNLTEHQTINAGVSSVKSDLAATSATLTNVKTKADSLDTSVTSLNTKVNDSTSGLTAIATKVNDSTTGLTAISTKINDSSTGLSALNTKITAIKEGIEIIPTVTGSTTNGGTGNISLAVTSGITQKIALRVEFRPTTDLQSDATYEGLIKALYTAATTPLVLRQASSTGTVVRGDYQVYYNSTDSKFHVGSIVFVTQEMALTADTAVTKALHFTYKAATAPSFEILVTPVIGSVTTTGATPTTW